MLSAPSPRTPREGNVTGAQLPRALPQQRRLRSSRQGQVPGRVVPTAVCQDEVALLDTIGWNALCIVHRLKCMCAAQLEVQCRRS